MRDVAAVRGLNSQRDIFRELKLIIQSPVGVEGGVYNISPSKKKQEIRAKGQLKPVVFFLSIAYVSAVATLGPASK